MAVENATTFAELDETLPLDTGPMSEADDHIRLIKKLLKDHFPNLDRPLRKDTHTLEAPYVKKMIFMWSGLVADIPEGFALCDGKNGTLDLTGRFVKGAALNELHQTGGSLTHKHAKAKTGLSPAHTHTLTVNEHQLTSSEMDKHKHNIDFQLKKVPVRVSQSGKSILRTDIGLGKVLTEKEGSGSSKGQGHDHPGTMGNGSKHDHEITTANATTTPPHYRLAYIQRIVD